LEGRQVILAALSLRGEARQFAGLVMWRSALAPEVMRFSQAGHKKHPLRVASAKVHIGRLACEV
jgi:hypothetical protein